MLTVSLTGYALVYQKGRLNLPVSITPAYLCHIVFDLDVKYFCKLKYTDDIHRYTISKTFVHGKYVILTLKERIMDMNVCIKTQLIEVVEVSFLAKKTMKLAVFLREEPLN